MRKLDDFVFRYCFITFFSLKHSNEVYSNVGYESSALIFILCNLTEPPSSSKRVNTDTHKL